MQCATFALLMSLASCESYLSIYPSIDTVYAPGYTEAAFDALKSGMTAEEVRAALGEPLWKVSAETCHHLAEGGAVGWCYTSDGSCSFADFAWLGRYVYFDQEGRVTTTVKVVHPD